jgi:chromosome partitioning protein
VNTVAFFNNTGGVGKSWLVYHLASMMADRGETVLVVDLHPQANLTSIFLTEDRLENLWPVGEHPYTICGTLGPIIRGSGDLLVSHIEHVGPRLGLLVGDLALSAFEDKLSNAWQRCHDRDESAFRTVSAFYRAVRQAAEQFAATWVLIDIGPNLDAINRAALIASEFVTIPLGPDLFSLQGLLNLGPSLRAWRKSWAELILKNPNPELDLPPGQMKPLGYVVMQNGRRENRPPKAYLRWIDHFPLAYRQSVLGETAPAAPSAENDSHCLSMLKHYRSLMPMAMEARKPVFFLKPADGAIGAHVEATSNAYAEFYALARRLADRSGAELR